MDSYNEVIKADCDARSSKTEKYMFTDKQINKAIKKCPLKNIKIYYREIFNYDGKEEEAKERDRSQFLEDYAANLAAQATEIILGNNIVRK